MRVYCQWTYKEKNCIVTMKTEFGSSNGDKHDEQ